MSTAISKQAPNLQWDCEVPDTLFWKDLHWKDGRAFFKCFSQDEVDQMQFDDGLDKLSKLDFLVTKIKEKIKALEGAAAPKSIQETDFSLWERLYFGIAQLEGSQGNKEEQDKVYRQMLYSGPDGTRNMSVVHDLSVMTEAHGNYDEAEKLATEALSWIEGHPKLGPNTPQAVGACKVLAQAYAKTGRKEEAQKWIDSGRARIDGFKGTIFEKYAEDSRQNFDEVVSTLI